MKNNFYFTFGSSSQFPLQNGYVKVIAEDLDLAITKFRKRFPDKTQGTVNCASWCTEEEWINKSMSNNDNYPLYETIQ